MQHKSEPHQKRSRGKIALGVVAVGLAAALLVGGSFAWTDFTQHKSNPIKRTSKLEVTLNDEFIPDDAFNTSATASKKISVTNPKDSEAPVFVRLQLKEFLETYQVTYTPIVDDDGEDVYFATWANGPDKGEYLTSEQAEAEGLQYETFQVDGVEYARIAKDLETNPENRNGIYGKTMNNPDAQGNSTINTTYGTVEHATKYTHRQTSEKEPGEIYECDYLPYLWDGKGIANRGNAADFARLYIEWNQGEQVVSMADWVAEDKPLGDFWVYDTDGWCYWANSIDVGESTANIMESLTLLLNPANDYEYVLHVEMEAADATDLDTLKTDATDNGKDLIDKLKPAYITSWTDNGDGTATRKVVSSNQFREEHTIIGLDGIPGTEDDNRIVNPAGTILIDTVEVTNPNNTPYVELGNEFRLYGGEDGKIGTLDDIVKGFGSYAQTDITGATKQALDWRLLDIQGNSAVLMTTNIVDSVKFNNSAADGNVYLNSNLYNWLNSLNSYATSGFYNTAFSDAEKAKIVNTVAEMKSETIPGAHAYVNSTTPGVVRPYSSSITNSTVEGNVFALSIGEYWQYFGESDIEDPNHFDLKRNGYARPTPYAREQGVQAVSGINRGLGAYWLRTPGSRDGLGALSSAAGGMVNVANSVYNASFGARPAVTVSLR